MTAQQKESILSRIKKLQSLTVERGATPEEAANAAAKAQSLLFEYNLTQAAVDLTGQEKPEKYENTTFTHQATRFDISWKRRLLNGIAINNFCDTVFHFGATTEDIIGKPSNVEVVIYLYQSIVRQIEAMAVEAAKTSFDKKLFKRNFCIGAVLTVRKRLAEQRREDVRKATATNQCTSLVLSNSSEALAVATKEFHPKVRSGSSMRISDRQGYDAGVAAGHRVSINRGLGGSNNKRIG